MANKEPVVTTTVDANEAPSMNPDGVPMQDIGADHPIDHPLTMSTVDPNLEPIKSPGFPKGNEDGSGSTSPRSSDSDPATETDDDMAGVAGAQDAPYTDDSTMSPPDTMNSKAGSKKGDAEDGGD